MGPGTVYTWITRTHRVGVRAEGVECVVRPHRSDGLPGRSRQNVSLRRIAYADVRARSTPRSRGDVRSASIVSGVEL